MQQEEDWSATPRPADDVDEQIVRRCGFRHAPQLFCAEDGRAEEVRE